MEHEYAVYFGDITIEMVNQLIADGFELEADFQNKILFFK